MLNTIQHFHGMYMGHICFPYMFPTCVLPVSIRQTYLVCDIDLGCDLNFSNRAKFQSLWIAAARHNFKWPKFKFKRFQEIVEPHLVKSE